MLPRATSPARRARRQRQGRRPHARDPAADRALAAGGRGLTQLGERTIWIDCDVIQADGGTRTASITGALRRARARARRMRSRGLIKTMPAARLRGGDQRRHRRRRAVLDLAYEEDSKADVDMNIVKTGDGRFIEVQGTAEHEPVRSRRAGDAARPGRRRHRKPDRTSTRHRRAAAAEVTPDQTPRGDDEPRQAGRDPHDSRRTRGLTSSAWRRSRGGGAGGDRRDVRRERARQGALLRGGHRAADRGRGFRAGDRRARRRARRPLGALRRRVVHLPAEVLADLPRCWPTAARLAALPGSSARWRSRVDREVVFEARGVVEGSIAPAPRGENGFGYDPIFFYPPFDCTLAEVPRARKAEVSHRGQAFRRLREFLEVARSR